MVVSRIEPAPGDPSTTDFYLNSSEQNTFIDLKNIFKCFTAPVISLNASLDPETEDSTSSEKWFSDNCSYNSGFDSLSLICALEFDI